MSLKKLLDENQKLQFFMNKSVQMGQTRNYWLRALSDVEKITSNQCDLHFYECLADTVASLNLHNIVWTSLDTYVVLTEVQLESFIDDWTIHLIRVL